LNPQPQPCTAQVRESLTINLDSLCIPQNFQQHITQKTYITPEGYVTQEK
jgi:hypothetical protein